MSLISNNKKIKMIGLLQIQTFKEMKLR